MALVPNFRTKKKRSGQWQSHRLMGEAPKPRLHLRPGPVMVATLDVTDLMAARRPPFGTLTLAGSPGRTLYTISISRWIRLPGNWPSQYLDFNTQHDCATAKCTDSHCTQHRRERPELEATGLTIAWSTHTSCGKPSHTGQFPGNAGPSMRRQ